MWKWKNHTCSNTNLNFCDENHKTDLAKYFIVKRKNSGSNRI